MYKKQSSIAKKDRYLIALNVDRLDTHSELYLRRPMRSSPKDLEGSVTKEMKNRFCAKECSDFGPPFCYHKIS